MRTWQIGDVTIHRIDEAILPPSTGAWLLPDVTAEQTAELDPAFRHDDGSLRLATHSFAVESEGRRILVDTAVGNHKSRANPAWHDLDTDWPAHAEAAGFGEGAVDLVVMTHVHADHVGWNTTLRDGVWVPTFPGARHLTSASEWSYWTSVELEPARAQMIADSVLPVRDAGLLDTPEVPDEGLALTSEVRLVPTPGHTPGHVSVEIRSSGDVAVISGDAVHHPVQVLHPEIGSCVDVDAVQAGRTREWLLEWVRERDALLLGTHFPEPTGLRLQGRRPAVGPR